jgi:hypothetical protein
LQRCLISRRWRSTRITLVCKNRRKLSLQTILIIIFSDQNIYQNNTITSLQTKHTTHRRCIYMSGAASLPDVPRVACAQIASVALENNLLSTLPVQTFAQLSNLRYIDLMFFLFLRRYFVLFLVFVFGCNYCKF